MSVASQENVDLAEKLHKHICKYFVRMPNDGFSNIGYGYVQNPEFKNNLDQFGDGTAHSILVGCHSGICERKIDKINKKQNAIYCFCFIQP